MEQMQTVMMRIVIMTMMCDHEQGDDMSKSAGAMTNYGGCYRYHSGNDRKAAVVIVMRTTVLVLIAMINTASRKESEQHSLRDRGADTGTDTVMVIGETCEPMGDADIMLVMRNASETIDFVG